MNLFRLGCCVQEGRLASVAGKFQRTALEEVRSMKAFLPVVMVAFVLGAMWCVVSSQEREAAPVEVIRLTDENWEAVAPRGKEVDAIVGDLVLRNRHLVAVIAQPLPTRNANMTVKAVAGALIDLTSRENHSDQLSAFYPGQREYAYRDWAVVDHAGASQPGDQVTTLSDAESASIVVRAAANNGKPAVETRYTLQADSRFVEVTTTYKNESTAAVKVPLTDDLRCDGGKEDMLKTPSGTSPRLTIEDRFWHQAYGFEAKDRQLLTNSGPNRSEIKYVAADGNHEVEVPAGGSFTLTRHITAAPTLPEVAAQLSGEAAVKVTLTVQSQSGVRINAPRVEIRQGESLLATIIGNERGELNTTLKPGAYTLTTAVNSIEASSGVPLVIQPSVEHSVTVPLAGFEPGTVIAQITDGEGRPIPCKVAFDVTDGSLTPSFGPETAVTGVKNLRYTPSGQFQQQLAPGKYQATISHGVEYDVAYVDIVVEAGQSAKLEAKLPRVVETTGWVSSDFHSHATESGDNTTSQLGRVLNLAAENIEFSPCTEHNRISSYDSHIDALQIRPFMATCSGLELTGSPFGLNHQNAFPMHHHPHRQDGGGPVTDDSPEVQIERIALWDDRSEKLIQQNHPDLGWLFHDRNGDGTVDEGHAKGFAFMDVIEVHPIHTLLGMSPTDESNGKVQNNTVFNWLQLLNQGHKIYGVVNTDAHYNFHGSGGYRNWIQSTTDDPAKIDTLEMVHASEQGRLVMSNGPFLEVWAKESGAEARVTCGQSLTAKSKIVELSIQVQCPNWFDIDRVSVLANGRIVKSHDYTRETHPDAFSNQVMKFDRTVKLELEGDVHLIVVAAGEKSLLGPVAGPEYGPQPPTAVSNPIFIDIAGDGFQPSQDTLGAPLPGKSGTAKK